MSRNPANNELPVGVNEPVDEESDDSVDEDSDEPVDEDSDDDGRPLFIEYFGPFSSYPRFAGVEVPFVPAVRDAFARRGHFDFGPIFIQALMCVLTFFCRPDTTPEEAEAAVDRFLAMFPHVNPGGGR